MTSVGHSRIQLFDVNHRAARIALRLMLLLALVAVVTLAAEAQTYQVLHAFTGNRDGAHPTAGLVANTAGTQLYGTALNGGQGYGTVYQLKHEGSGWVFNPLYGFAGGGDGAGPGYDGGALVIAPNGTVYGTTNGGGDSNCNNAPYGGCGTVFNLHPPATVCTTALCPWDKTAVYRFSGEGSDDGFAPAGTLLFSSGNIYGTTIYGGAGGAGTLYELTPSGGGWTESVLYSFGAGGVYPISGVALNGGDFYGTAYEGGSLGGGIAYQLVPNGSGWTENILANFGCNRYGDYPWAGLIFDSQGNIYGANSDAGPSCGGAGGGAVFEFIPSGGTWTLNILYNIWDGQINANCGPRATLTMDASGNLYGTTYCDGANGLGNVFELSPCGSGCWVYADLHDFTGGSDGGNPISTVVVDMSGNLYGTASTGGTGGVGVVWQITP